MSNRVNLETSPLGQSSKSAPRHAVVLLLLVLLEVLVRVLAVYHFGEGQWSIASFSDEKNYYLPAARAILEQGSAFFLTPRSLWNGPVNPLWIALWQADIASVKIANIVLISLCSLCVWDIARVLFGYAAAYTALALFILYPPFLEFAPTVLTEPPFIFLLALSFWFYVCCRWRMPPAAICAGIALGLAILTRPTAQLFPLFLLCIIGVVWLVSWCTGKSLQFGQRKLVTFAVAAALTITPYIAKNYFCFGKLGIANGLGAVLYLGNDLRTSGDEPLYSQMSFDTYDISRPHAHLDSEGDRKLVSAALQNILAHPKEIFFLSLKKPIRYLFGHPAHYFHPANDIYEFGRKHPVDRTLYRLIDVLLTCLIVSFGLCGLFCLSLRADIRVLFISFVFYMLGLHTVTFPLPRLALPMFPLLIALAAGALCCLSAQRRWVPFGLASALSLGCAAYILFGEATVNRYMVNESVLAGFSTKVEIAPSPPQSLHGVSFEDGVYLVTGKDPYVVLSVAPFKTFHNQVIFVEVRATRGNGKVARASQLQIFWAAQPEEPFREANSATFAINPDSEFHWYRISPSSHPKWTGTLGALRLDFADRGRGDRYSVRRIVIAH